MTPYSWPADLPLFSRDPYSVAPRPGNLQLDVDGQTSFARVYTQANDVVQCEALLSSTQEPVFRDFFRSTVAMGTQWFTAPILRAGTLEPREVLFIGAPPAFTPANKYGYVRARFTLLTRGVALAVPPPPAPFACETPVSATYLVAPAWTSYPTGIAIGTTVSAPFQIDAFTGRITFATNKVEMGAGESPLPPLTLTAVFSTRVYEHIGTLVSSGVTINVPIHAPAAGVWGGGTLRKFIIEATPVQFSNGLFIARRQGYAGAGFSAFFTSGLATADGGYLGDFESYSPAAYGGSRGGAFEVARAKYLNGNVYAQLGTGPANLTSSMLTFSALGGSVPAPSLPGGSYSGEDLFDDPVLRTFADTVRDIACDFATGDIYVLHRSGGGVLGYSVTILRINPTTLATIGTWVKNTYFSEAIDGFSVSGSRVVLASGGGAIFGRHYWVMDLNGSGGMDLVHNGNGEVDPGNTLATAYVWADPLCGFLKQKNRWISPVVGP